MPAFVRKSLETDKKEKPSKHNPRKLEDQTLFKSINRSATKYPSPPGVEGAPGSPLSPPAHHKQKTKQRPATPKAISAMDDKLCPNPPALPLPAARSLDPRV